MTTFAICMVRDEADIIAHTLAHIGSQVDGILAADNGSTDGTRQILDANEMVIEVIDDEEIGYYQSRKMSALAKLADGYGADWVIPMDADEAWYSPHGRIADVLNELDPGIAVAPALVYDHVATGLDGTDSNPLKRTCWRRRQPNPLPKMACRPVIPATIEQGNHGVTYAGSMSPDLLVVRHFPYRSAEQMVRKAVNGAEAYAATDLPEHEGQHWRDYGRIVREQGPEALGDVFRQWFWAAYPENDDSLIFDPCP